MELVLGTAQWGLAYGIAGQGRPATDNEVLRLLSCAAEAGLRRLDTAQAYGDIEARLATLLAATSGDWRVTTKIPAVPNKIALEDVGAWVEGAVALSSSRLGDRLETVLLHDPSILDDMRRGTAVWDAFSRACSKRSLAAGFSAYDPAEAAHQAGRLAVDQVQLPANALDQRLLDARLPQRATRHLRSVFLQGLLINKAATRKLPAAVGPLTLWWDWCRLRGLAPMCAALSVVRAIDPLADGLVVGVESSTHLDELLRAWEQATPISAPELRCDDPFVIDPRQWTIAR